MLASRALPALCLLLTAAVAGQTPPAPDAWPVRDAPAALRPVIARADLYVVEMQGALLRQLRDKLEQGGPALALGACHIDVTALTARLGRTDRIAAGFTSDRLRDPINQPRPWAAALVAANARRQARDVDGFVVELGERVGLLRPLVQQPICAACHGPVDGISPEVRTQLAARYPSDRAVGFDEGEIRGWFWIELPK